MLKFRIVNILFVLFSTIFFVIAFLGNLDFLYFFIIALVYISILFYGSFFVGSGFYMPVVCRNKSKGKAVSITFDDGPDKVVTEKVIKILGKYNVCATFFLIGTKIKDNEVLLAEMHSKGHILGNHTWSHSPSIDLYSADKIVAEIIATNEEIKRITGSAPEFFRPPFGITNPSIAKAVIKTGMKTIGWNIRSLDTHKSKDAARVSKRVKKKLSDGSIILFHDINDKILDVLEEIIPYIQKKGYKIVPLDQLIN